MKSDKKGFALLMEWSGKDRRYLFGCWGHDYSQTQCVAAAW